MFMYVDDTAVVLACSVYNDGTHILQRDILSILHWLNGNKGYAIKSKTNLIYGYSSDKIFK